MHNTVSATRSSIPFASFVVWTRFPEKAKNKVNFFPMHHVCFWFSFRTLPISLSVKRITSTGEKTFNEFESARKRNDVMTRVI